MKSPYGLIQEELRENPWKLLIACIMLNLTSIKQVRPVIDEFFKTYPDEMTAAKADESELAELLKPLGLHNRRAKTIIKFSQAIQTKWNDVRELPGVGKYASDSYSIFILNETNLIPSDKKLKLYLEWNTGAVHGNWNEMHEDH